MLSISFPLFFNFKPFKTSVIWTCGINCLSYMAVQVFWHRLLNHLFHSSFFTLLYCLWWAGCIFILFPYSISVSKPIMECYEQLPFPKDRLRYKTLHASYLCMKFGAWCLKCIYPIMILQRHKKYLLFF